MSLLSEIYEQLEYERLIEEGKDPVEVLHYKFQYIPSDVIDAVIEIDPTKKKSYSQWLLSKWKDESDTIIDNLKNGRIAKLFNHYKNHQDVQIKNCPSVAEGLRAFAPEEDTVLSKSSKPKTYIENLGKEVDSDLANDFDVVFNEDGWIIAVPNTYESECKLGENMKWCTANAFGNGERFYDNYVDRGGKLYVNFDMSHGESRNGKDYPFTRYQFHFETKQFMDKNDSPIILSELDLPQSVIDFYMDEGYDLDDYQDEEAQYEAYCNRRNECAFILNNDLYLNIAFDDDYRFEEPDEDTNFYVFHYNDDRDPLGYESVPNPHMNNDVVLKKTSQYIILRSNSDEASRLVLNYENGVSYSCPWESYEVSEEMIELPDEMGLFVIDNKQHYTLLTNNESTYRHLEVTNCEGMSINESCTNADKYERIFIETINDNYHSLFTVEFDGTGEGYLDCIVRKDTPINGEYYVINENGMVQGAFGTYRVYDEESVGEYSQYDLEQDLGNGFYAVSTVVRGDELKFNIVRKGENKPLIGEWVDKVIDFKGGFFICSRNIDIKKAQVGFFNVRGEQVGNWYDNYGFLDVENGFVVGGNGDKRFGGDESYQLISASENRIIAEFKQFLTNKQVDNKVIVVCNDGIIRGYDYAKKEFCYQEFETILRCYQSDSRNFYCKLRGKDEHCIFDFDKQRISAEHIANVRRLTRGYGLFELIKTDGTCNVYSPSDACEILPMNVNDIDTADDFFGLVTYTLNGRWFAYDYKKKQLLINPNGVDMPIVFLASNGTLRFQENNVTISFSVKDSSFYSWSDENNRTYGNQLNQDTPQEVYNLYNRVTNQQPIRTNDVTEQFKRMVSRINEAMKLTYGNIID